MNRGEKKSICKDIIFVFFVFLILTMGFTQPVHALGPWELVFRNPGGTYRGAVNNGSIFVMVGDQGLVATSPTGLKGSWSIRNTPTTYNLYAVTWGEGKFVAVGYHGIILTSADGIKWTTRVGYTTAGLSLTSVAHNGYWFVAGGIQGIIRRSQDGTKWTTVPTGTVQEFRGMCARLSDGMFVGSTSSGYIFKSTDNGASWGGQQISYKNFYSAVHGRDRFIVGGQDGSCWYLKDGETSWKQCTTNQTNYLMDLIYVPEDDTFVACGNSDGYSYSMIIEGNGEPGGWKRKTTPDFSTLYCLAASSDRAISAGARRLVIKSEIEGSGGPASLTIITPAGGEEYEVGAIHNLTWISSNLSGHVRIEYSINGGTSWKILDNDTKNDGVWGWLIPDTPSDQCQVKITSVSNTTVFDVSETLTIVNPIGITINSPNGGEEWSAGSKHAIIWTSRGAVGDTVKVSYSVNNGTNWYHIENETDNDGVYNWTVPDNLSDTCLVRIVDVSNFDNIDYSNEVFSIIPGITVDSPNGGEGWSGGSIQDILWTTYGTIDKVKIEYSSTNGASWEAITSSTENDGVYSWTVPGIVSDICLVRISEADLVRCVDTSDSVFSIQWPPELSLSKTELNFGHLIRQAVPRAQSIYVYNTGGGTLNWAASTIEPWLIPSPSSGVGGDTLNISIIPEGLATGDYIGTIVVSSIDVGVGNSPQTITINLKVKNAGQNESPFGELATPQAPPTPADEVTVFGSIPITGWVLDDVQVEAVQLYYNENSYIGEAIFVEGARPDIEVAYPDYPENSRAGWGYMMLTNSLPDGSYLLYAVAIDNSGRETRLGERSIVIDNLTAVKPFGTIDAPTQGGLASGERFINWGWTLTPIPNTIPTDGSTILIWLDGVLLDNPYEYSVYNPLIASQFGGYNNSEGAAAYLHIDTTQYENGVHIIAWSVTDDASNTNGIGSRYFTIQNSGVAVGGEVNAADSLSTLATGKVKFQRKQGPYHHLSQIENIPIGRDAVGIRRGYHLHRGPAEKLLESGDNLRIEFSELDRVEIQLKDDLSSETFYTGYHVVGEDLRPLPPGATLDIKKGTFYWQLGAGILGTHRFIFVENYLDKEVSRKEIQLHIVPRKR